MQESNAILLTGGSGFIGSHIISAFGDTRFVLVDLEPPQPLPSSCLFAKADVRDVKAMRTVFETHHFDSIIHLAAAHKDFGIEQEEYMAVNVDGTGIICQLASEFGVHKIIFFSSVAVYGDREEVTSESSSPRPTNEYGASKLAAEQVIIGWQKEEVSRCAIILRPALVFGEGNVANMFRLIDQIDKGRYFHVGKGDNIKSIAYVKNVVGATKYLFNHFNHGLHIYNYVDEPQLKTAEIGLAIARELGKPEPKSFPRNLLLLVAKPFDLLIRITGRDLPISSKRVRKLGTQTYYKAEQVFAAGYKPEFTSQEGLARMVAWYKQRKTNKTDQ
jgi:GlcNAc-P-P-Und epimerase